MMFKLGWGVLEGDDVFFYDELLLLRLKLSVLVEVKKLVVIIKLRVKG